MSKIIYEKIFKFNEEDDNNENMVKNFTREPINLYIDSNGGDIYNCMSIISLILKSKTPIHTYCFGICASAAFKIFLAGHKRFCSRFTTFMFHDCYCIYGSKLEGLEQFISSTSIQRDIVLDFIVERTKIKKEKLNQIIKEKKDWYILSKEALELGIVDEIL